MGNKESTASTAPTTATPSYSTTRLASVNTPTSAPPQPPSTTPRNVKDALNVLGNRENPYGTTNGISSISKKPDVAPKPHDVSPKPESVPRKSPPRQLDGYVGFANLPNQLYRKSVKQGFEFTLMVVGESGLGKSTLINSLFLSDLYSDDYPGPSHRIQKTVKVETTKIMLREHGVSLKLTVCDTPGFGDAVNNNNCWEPVINHIESKFEDYLNAESEVQRTTLNDNRVHCCLYFIAPTGHGLKPLDIEFMKKVHNKVNIIPIIAKADTLTGDECNRFKQQILKEIVDNQINIYRFPPLSEDEGDDLASLRRIPFAVVGSNTVLEVNGKKIRGRKYPWGIVEVENVEHCDFIALRNLLLRTHMQDLIDVTNDTHYESYRRERLSVLTGGGASITSATLNINPMEQIEREREDQEKKLQKMEQEMEQVFDMKVKEKKKKLADSEAEFNRKFEVTMRTLESSKKEIEERRKKFEVEREQFDQTYASEGLNNKANSRSSLMKPLDKDKKEKKKKLF